MLQTILAFIIAFAAYESAKFLLDTVVLFVLMVFLGYPPPNDEKR